MNTTDGNIVSPNPPVPGQGGWAVLEFQTNNVGSQIRSYEARIEPEAGRGNVLVFEDIPQLNATGSGVRITRVLGNITSGEGGGIESHWSERASGNNILKFEYDLYTGNLSPTPNLINSAALVRFTKATNNGIYLYERNQHVTTSTFVTFLPAFSGMLYFTKTLGAGGGDFYGTFPDETWITIAMYIDYTTGHIYQEVPSMNKTIKTAHPLPLTPNTIGDHITLLFVTDPSEITNNISNDRDPYFVKFDNLKFSAVNTLPLSMKKLANTTFTILPNPATNLITVKNSENIGIEQIEVFDSSGKSVKKQSFANESQIQIDMSTFESGIYLMNIITKEGMTVEKVVKE